ncbi:MAG: hypothetical protein KGM47_09345 [Acidobacteriota bacterium]|nr:hypothetical protein [Acidobacteriota bacterium]
MPATNRGKVLASRLQVLALAALFLLPASALAATRPAVTFQQKLQAHMTMIDARRCTFVQGLLEVALKANLPLALEYVDQNAAEKPLGIVLPKGTARRTIEAIVRMLPEYRVSFTEGLVDVYSPEARANRSNLLNEVIPQFQVEHMDVAVVGSMLYDALGSLMQPRVSFAHSVAGAGGPPVSVDVQHMRVYQILNMIVAGQGSAMWTVGVPPPGLTKLQGNLWHLYPLAPALAPVILERLRGLFPAQPHQR